MTLAVYPMVSRWRIKGKDDDTDSYRNFYHVIARVGHGLSQSPVTVLVARV
jgi:hypothetical protein